MLRIKLMILSVFLAFLIAPLGTIPVRAEGSSGLNGPVFAATAAPNQPALVQPANNATGISTSPTLAVTASDPDGADSLNVTFYGRPANSIPVSDFTLVLFPDIQNESQYAPEMLTAQMNWIVAHQNTDHIVFATSLGDLVNTDTSTSQYANASAGFDILDAGGVPYSVGPGNRDLSSGTLFNDYFGVSRFSGKSWYGGHYGSDNDNNYSLFSVSGNDFILINLQYDPSSAQLNWADALLKQYSNRRAIVEQHDILNADNSWLNPSAFNALKDNPNLFLMVCGHKYTSTDGAAYREEQGDDGHPIYIVLADYQEMHKGNGLLRILRFSPADDMIHMTTYSPYTGGSITTDPDQKDLAYDLSNGATTSYALINTATGVANGANASISWPGLDANTSYEWYAAVSDGTATTNGPTWSFTTGSPAQACYTLTLNHSGQGSDPAASPARSAACTTDGQYVSGEDISLSGAAPISGWHVSGWTGTANDVSTSSTNSLAMPASAQTVWVNYAQNVNSAPIIAEGSSTNVSMSEDGAPDPFQLTLHATDADGDPLTWVIMTQAANGSASASSGTGAANTIDYVPNLNYHGSDSFVVQVSDGKGGIDTITINVTINPVNDAPTSTEDSYTTPTNQILTIPSTSGVLANDSDVDGDVLNAILVNQPEKGTLVLNKDGSIIYTPEAGFFGVVTFTYRANDGQLDSNTSLVQIVVTRIQSTGSVQIYLPLISNAP